MESTARRQAERASESLGPETLIRRHQNGVWRYLRVLGCGPVEADDLVQDTFLVLLRADFERRTTAETWAFLLRTARHLFLDRCRADRRRDEAHRADLVDELWARQSDPGGDEWLTALRACLESLDGKPRRAIDLFYGEGRPRAEVAEAMQMKENGVKTLLQRTRAVLRDCIDRRMR